MKSCLVHFIHLMRPQIDGCIISTFEASSCLMSADCCMFYTFARIYDRGNDRRNEAVFLNAISQLIKDGDLRQLTLRNLLDGRPRLNISTYRTPKRPKLAKLHACSHHHCLDEAK